MTYLLAHCRVTSNTDQCHDQHQGFFGFSRSSAT